MTDATPKRRGRPGPNTHLPDDSPFFICPRCRETKPRDQFQYRGKRPRRCKACWRAEYEANREVLIERSLKWQRANPERAAARTRAHYEKNRDKALEYGREYGKQWNADHPGAGAERARRRKERLSQVASIPYTAEQLAERFAYYEGRCWMCGAPGDQRDHVKPVAAGGPDILANIRPACDPCNSSKGAKWPVDSRVVWMPRSGRRGVLPVPSRPALGGM